MRKNEKTRRRREQGGEEEEDKYKKRENGAKDRWNILFHFYLSPNGIAIEPLLIGKRQLPKKRIKRIKERGNDKC